MRTKITNATSKPIMLINGTTIKPGKSVTLTLKKGTDLYEQVKNLEKMGLVDLS